MDGQMLEGAGKGLFRDAVLIAGPTASGKSALAVEIAARIGGAVVNADSMQVYSVLNVLSARPRAADLARVAHHLYGHVHPTIVYSAGAWLRDVESLCRDNGLEGLRPVFVGGTGLYFSVLTEGLSDMPPIPPGVRARWRTRLADIGPERLHETLRGLDGEAADAIAATDGQRIARALEVMEASGRPMSAIRADRSAPLVDMDTALAIVLEPGRAELHRRIDARFEEMVARGAIDEVRELCRMPLPADRPAAKAIGIRPIAAHLAGDMSLGEAIERAQAQTRQYAKRQSTWFRNQFKKRWLRAESAEEALRMVNSLSTLSGDANPDVS